MLNFNELCTVKFSLNEIYRISRLKVVSKFSYWNHDWEGPPPILASSSWRRQYSPSSRASGHYLRRDWRCSWDMSAWHKGRVCRSNYLIYNRNAIHTNFRKILKLIFRSYMGLYCWNLFRIFLFKSLQSTLALVSYFSSWPESAICCFLFTVFYFGLTICFVVSIVKNVLTYVVRMTKRSRLACTYVVLPTPSS